jgi:predicted RNA binding protein YcfA (HicA-like mRNA interferase family)
MISQNIFGGSLLRYGSYNAFRFPGCWRLKSLHRYDTRWMPVKVRELIRVLEKDGWFIVRTSGSHRQFHHASKAGTVTVAGKPSVEIPPGTLNSILKQAGMK